MIMSVKGGSAFEVPAVYRICPTEHVILTDVHGVMDSVAMYVCCKNCMQLIYH